MPCHIVTRVSLLCIVCLMAGSLSALAAPTKVQRAGLEYQIDKVPAWVEKISDNPAATRAPQDIGPNQILLSDTQVSLLADKPVYFAHLRSVARERSGLEAVSTLKLTFNPRFETLTLHELSVVRDGKKTSKLKSARIDLAQRERRLEEGVYDEDVQAIVALDDVRIGDVVEYAYSIAGENPVFAGKYAQFFALNRDIPVARLSILIKHPAGRKLNYKLHRSALPVSEAVKGAVKTFAITADNLPVVRTEPSVPGWFPMFPALQVSEYASWEQMQQWAATLYKTPTDLSPELEQLLDKIKSESTDQRDLVARVLAWVQNEIRYYSVAVGTSSHRPNHPNVTFRQRFGDCKDKSVLLSAMLKRLGVKAEAALIASQVRQGIADWLPTPLAFDHVIVRASVDQATYWLDGTLTYQGSKLDTLGFTPFQKALLTETASTDLTDVVAPLQARNDSQVVENITVPSYGAPAIMVVEAKYFGGFAEWFRRSVANVGIKRYVESLQTDYGRDFPNIALNGEAAVIDDPAANVVTFTQSFQIPKLFAYEKGRVTQSFYASTIVPALRFPNTPERLFPLALPYPWTLNHRIVLNLPNRLDIPSPSPANWQDRHVSLSNSIKTEGNQIIFDYGMRTFEDHVAAADFPAYAEKVKKASNLLFSTATLPLIPTGKLRERVYRDMEKAKADLRNPDGAENLRQKFLADYAIADEVVRSKLAAGNILAQAYYDRALANSLLARRESALADINQSLELDNNDDSLVLKAEVQLYSGQYQAALDTLGLVGPGNDKRNVLVARGMMNFYLGKYAEAASAFGKAAEVANGDELPHTLIWYAVAAKRAGQDAGAGLAKFRARLSSSWPAEGVALVMGEIAPDALLAAARQNQSESRMRLCEAYFYLGQKALVDGNRDDAKRWFGKSIDTNVVMYREHTFAQLELKRLER